MFDGYVLTNIIRVYYAVRTMHGIYISYKFLSWLLVGIYGIGTYILYYIPKPSLQISYREMYYDVEEEDYIEIKKY